jgi:beta-lactamase class D
LTGLSEAFTPLSNNYEVYGKTGTGTPEEKNGILQEDRQFGGFVGWAQKQGKQYIFVHNVNEIRQKGVFASVKAKADILSPLVEVLPKDD